jgi:hypothetical protein
MTEFFIHATSFAAPFVGDETTGYVQAETPEAALEKYAATIYGHPCGLYAADCYASADAFHKRQPRLARWLSNKAQAVEGAIAKRGAASIYSESPDKVEINGEMVEITDPKAGCVV